MSTKTIDQIRRMPTLAEVATAAGVTEAELRRHAEADPSFLGEATFAVLAEQPEAFDSGLYAVIHTAD